MTLLSIRELSMAIHGTPVLRSVSLDVEAGEALGVIGESGSGKSMTALSVMRLLPGGSEVDGKITFEGQDLLSLSEPQMCDLRGRRIGMIFQEPMTALNPLKTIGSQVAETVLIHERTSVSAAAQRAREALDRVELPASRFPLDLYPHELSGGQRQRVGIAMAIALQPALLIADEPTTALDVTTQAQILTLIRQLVDEDGMGLMMITHDLAVVAGMAERIVIMKQGEIVEKSTGAQLFSSMKHPYTRALYEASAHQPDRKPLSDRQGAQMLEVQGVTRDYALPRRSLFAKPEHFRAVDGVSFSIARGESVGLVGESGCGKSTLARAILGLEEAQGGQILLDDTPVWSGHAVNRTVRQKMQVVFQDPYGSFNPRHRVDRLICEPFHLLDEPPRGAARDRAIAEALESVGLSEADRHKYPHEFSGGQRQRIAIARALIIRPQLIVLDEAVSALDVSIRARILDLLADLSERFGLAYLFITHDLTVVRAITDRVMVMQAGRIVEQGPTARVLDVPQEPYTQQLIAAAPKLPTRDAA